MNITVMFSESQKKKSNNQDDSDEDDDDDEAGPSAQQVAAVQPQAGYATPMAQPGMPPVAGAPGMPPGGYQGKDALLYAMRYIMRVRSPEQSWLGWGPGGMDWSTHKDEFTQTTRCMTVQTLCPLSLSL